jgi:hypothetical protein
MRMRRFSRLFPIVAVLLAPAISTRQSSVTSFAKVHIVAVDDSGRDLGEAISVSFEDAEKHDWAKHFRGNVAEHIPYGAYRIKIAKEGFWPGYADIYVYKPEVWGLVALFPGEEAPAFPSPSWVASGTVVNLSPADAPIYVKLVGAYSNFVMEDRVDIKGTSGSFLLTGENAEGKFVLLTMGRAGILDLREVDLPSRLPIEIDLALRH